MSNIKYYEGVNKIEISDLNKWIENFIDVNEKRLDKENIVLVSYNNYKIVLSKYIKGNYSISLIQDEIYYMRYNFTKQDDFVNIKNELMSQILILKKFSRGEKVELCKIPKIIDVEKITYINTRQLTKTENNKNKETMLLSCNNCAFINRYSQCIKRSCKIYDNIEATWCKYYKASLNIM